MRSHTFYMILATPRQPHLGTPHGTPADSWAVSAHIWSCLSACLSYAHTHSLFSEKEKGNSIRGLCASHCSAIICWAFSFARSLSISISVRDKENASSAASAIDFDLCTVNTRQIQNVLKKKRRKTRSNRSTQKYATAFWFTQPRHNPARQPASQWVIKSIAYF